MSIITLQQSLRYRIVRFGVYLHENDFQKTFVIGAITAGVVLFAGLIMFNLGHPARAIYASTAVTTTGSSSVMRELNIANNGLIFLRGAKVIAVSGDQIETSTAWDSGEFDWTVNTTAATRFFDYSGQKQAFSDIKVGDMLTVTGKLAKNNDKLSINADFVRQ